MFNNVHPGSWFGLPDFGVTEAIGSLFGGAKTAQGGSDIFLNPGNHPPSFQGPVKPGETISGQSPFASRQVLGSSTPNNLVPAGNPIPPGGTGGNMPSTPQQATPTIDPVQREIDNVFNSSMNYLGGLENSLRSNQPGITGEINSNYNTGSANLERSQQTAEGQIGQSQQQGEQRKQDALTAARNLYNELIMGGNQRFGGASSAGEAYQALAGRELQRNSQQVQTDYSSFMGQVAQARNNLQMQYQNSLASLEQQRQSALNQAQRDFQDKLNQINAMRTEAAQTKATARLNAITDLRNQIFQINVATAQNSQTVQNYARQLHDQLAQYEQQAMSQAQSAQAGQQAFLGQASTNPSSALNMGDGSAQGVPQQYIGMINPNKDQQLVGQINPFDRRNRFA